MSLFILNHAFGFDSLRSKWNAPIFCFFFPLSLLFQGEPLFHCCKANRGLKLRKLTCNSRSPEKDYLHIYSLCERHGLPDEERFDQEKKSSLTNSGDIMNSLMVNETHIK
jgi:hypothetical protein